MSDVLDPVGRLQLVGYEELTPHGLALPVFGRSLAANVFYTARSSEPGGAGGHIVSFDHYEPEALVPLRLEQLRETEVGEPWLDIFLWEGVVYVGTALEIWHALAEVREDIAEHSPLSLLALAEGVEAAPDVQLARNAFSWLMRRFGREKAEEWRNDSYLRGIVLKSVRREIGAYADETSVRRALQEELKVYQVGNKIIIDLPIPDFEGLGTFSSRAVGLGLKPEIAIRDKRTSENAMRIAALQVAASKPRGRASTTEIKSEISKYVTLTLQDLLPSKTRPNEVMYQQIVGNIVSHRASKNNIFAMGWATYTTSGIQITEAGRQYLKTLGLLG
jgi:hypothetical protein